MGAFFGTALLRIAKESVGCATEPPEGEATIPPCEGRIQGIKPSSLLTTYTLIVGLVSASILPLLGAIIDYTNHRRLVGRIVSALFCISCFPQIFLNETNFIAMAYVQLFSSFIGWAQTEITYSYLPELTNDENLLNDYTKSFTVAMFTAAVVFLLIIIGSVTLAGYGDNDLITSRVGMSTGFIICILLLPISWGKLFGERKAMHPLPDGQSLWTAGFIQLFRTTKKIATNFRALKWFYLAVAMSDSGTQTFSTIAVTYFVDNLQFNATESGIAILIILLGFIPGGFISQYVTKRTDPVKSIVGSLVLQIVATTLFSIFLVGPNQQLETYAISFLFGIGSGWNWTCARLLASTIIPEGQDAELMGVFLFAGQVLTWIPPLVFTAQNEANISQRVGVATLNVYFAFALLFYYLIGGYKKAREEVGHRTHYGVPSKEESETEDVAKTNAEKETASA